MAAVPWTQASEAALIVASQARDQQAFSELVRRRQSWARGLLRRLCAGDHALADDLAQEAFVKAWDRLGDLQTPQAFPGWFRRVAVTAFLMHKRKHKAQHDSIDDVMPLASEESLPDSQAGARLDLERALAVLSEAERVCVTLNHGEGMSHAEIAEATGLPLGTVKSHVTRGVEKLRRVLRQEAA